jgi:hypothetical protein
LSQHLRFLVTVDSATGATVKVEQLGQAGDLSEVDATSFLRGLGTGSGGAGAPPNIVVNIFAGGAPWAQGATVTAQGATMTAVNPMQNLGIDPAPNPPPRNPVNPVNPPPNKPPGQ